MLNMHLKHANPFRHAPGPEKFGCRQLVRQPDMRQKCLIKLCDNVADKVPKISLSRRIIRELLYTYIIKITDNFGEGFNTERCLTKADSTEKFQGSDRQCK